MGLWDVFIHEVVGPTTAVETDRFHFLLSSLWKLNQGVRPLAVFAHRELDRGITEFTSHRWSVRFDHWRISAPV